MRLKKAFFLLTFSCLFLSLIFVVMTWRICDKAVEGIPSGGVAFALNGTMTFLEEPSPQQQNILELFSYIRFFSAVLFPVCGLGIAAILFYHLKLKKPIDILQAGTERILKHDLDFSITAVSNDELGQICAAFEMMRAELLKTNRELWRQAEERKRLNVAFSHDLRNPVTVLKGTVKMLKQGIADEQALDRLESYTLRIEQYVEAMSSIQRLEQMPVQIAEHSYSKLRAELEDTASLLAPTLQWSVAAPTQGTVLLDNGLFLTVAENLIGNAARYAQHQLTICLKIQDRTLILTIIDDGVGYPKKMIQEGPKPFGKMDEDSKMFDKHFGMGLYSSAVLCMKHGGALMLDNKTGHGAVATATFQVGNE